MILKLCFNAFLDGVVRAPGDHLGYLGPLVAPLLVAVEDHPVLK